MVANLLLEEDFTSAAGDLGMGLYTALPQAVLAGGEGAMAWANDVYEYLAAHDPWEASPSPRRRSSSSPSFWSV